MLQNIGFPGLMLILVVVLVLFGPSKLPELGRAVGRTLHEFKNSARELVGEGKEVPEHIEPSDKRMEKSNV